MRADDAFDDAEDDGAYNVRHVLLSSQLQTGRHLNRPGASHIAQYVRAQLVTTDREAIAGDPQSRHSPAAA